MESKEYKSLLKREVWLRRQVQSLRKWTSSYPESDFQLLRGQEYVHYFMILYFGSGLIRTGAKVVLDAKNWFDLQVILTTFIFLFVLSLIYNVIRLRWALKAFERFAPQMIGDLSNRIAEQSVPSDGLKLSNCDSPNTPIAPTDAH